MKTNIYFEVSRQGNNSLYLGFIVINGLVERQFALLNENMEQNQCELKAFIHGMQTAKEFGWLNENTVVYTSSQNIIRCFKEGWITKWQKNGWKNSSRKEVRFKEDWQEAADLFYEFLPELVHSKGYKRKLHVTDLRRKSKSYLRKITKNRTIYNKGADNGAVRENS